MASSQDFARVTLPNPPAEYNMAYFRTLNHRLENLISSRLGRLEQPLYWGAAYTFVTGTDSSQAIAATTNTVVQFDTLEVSRDSLISFDGAAFDFTVAPVADLIFFVSLRNDGTTGTCRVILRKNGATSVSATLVSVAAGIDLVATLPAHAAAGDVFDIVIYASNAMNLDLTLSTCHVVRLSTDPRILER